MRLVTHEIEHKPGLRVTNRDGNWVCPPTSLDMDYKTVQKLIETVNDLGRQLLEYVSDQDPYKIRDVTPTEEVSLLAPILHPRQDVIYLGINYMAHAEELARLKEETFDGERSYAVYFSKRVNRAMGLGVGTPSHRDIVTNLDHETELTVIIGHEASHVGEEEVKDYIFGYTIINDVSTRTLQTRHKQWYFGKGLDGFSPTGPCIAAVDELSHLPKVQIQSGMNGEPRQDSNTEQLIFDISHIVNELSRGMTLRPGAIIATGTPAGVGMDSDPPKFPVPGDVVECTIEGIGTITNRVTD